MLKSVVGVSLMATILCIGLYYLTGWNWIMSIPFAVGLFLFTRALYNTIRYTILNSAKHIKIRKGWRRGEWKFKLFLSWWSDGLVSHYRFNSNCLYRLLRVKNDKEDNNGDINKLFGVSHWHVHKNSARFGWNCNKEQTKIKIYAYYYLDGLRFDSFLKEVDVNEFHKYEIKFINGYAIYFIDDVYIFRHKFERKIFGYENYPYFGGDRKAPHKMEIYRRRK